jgi:hypothetical protein
MKSPWVSDWVIWVAMECTIKYLHMFELFLNLKHGFDQLMNMWYELHNWNMTKEHIELNEAGVPKFCL